MMTRLQVQEILEKILESDRVYFQPPENFKLKYPCIIYSVGAGNRVPGDNKKYLFFQGYEVTYITKDPDKREVYDKLLDLPYAQPERQYKADGLYHWVCFIYF